MICRTHNYCKLPMSKDTATRLLSKDTATGLRLTVKLACGRLPVDFLIFVRPNAARG